MKIFNLDLQTHWQLSKWQWAYRISWNYERIGFFLSGLILCTMSQEVKLYLFHCFWLPPKRICNFHAKMRFRCLSESSSTFLPFFVLKWWCMYFFFSDLDLLNIGESDMIKYFNEHVGAVEFRENKTIVIFNQHMIHSLPILLNLVYNSVSQTKLERFQITTSVQPIFRTVSLWISWSHFQQILFSVILPIK